MKELSLIFKSMQKKDGVLVHPILFLVGYQGLRTLICVNRYLGRLGIRRKSAYRIASDAYAGVLRFEISNKKRMGMLVHPILFLVGYQGLEPRTNRL